MTDLITKARAILAANDRGGYTVPTDRLYPFQWNWDSAFVAMGFATYDISRALSELERLVEGQWADGMIPQIIFHQPSDTYFPGPDVWRTAHRIPTSGITQPPVFALALEEIAHRAAPRFEPRLRALYRAALANHRWWAKARDPQGRGQVAILHNWETGRDNSPEWDVPFARVPQTTDTVIIRRDLGHVDAAMRPRDEDYRRYIHLVDLYASLGWDPVAMAEKTPFKVADIGINAILNAAEAALERLALRFGTEVERREIAERRHSLGLGLSAMWSGQKQCFISQDLIDGTPIPVATSAGFLPLLTDVVTPEQVGLLAGRLRQLHHDGVLLVPSTLPGETGFEPKRYWRGPVWAVMNLLIARGFLRHGHAAEAGIIMEQMLELFAKAGFCEYFDPLTREGLGGGTFSWTAAVALLLLEPETRQAA